MSKVLCKLLIVTTVPITLRSFLLPYALFFRTKGWQVDAAAHSVSDDTDCVTTFSAVHNIQWHRNPLHWANVLAMRALKRLVIGNAYDIVHVHTPVAAFLTRLALRKLRAEGRVKVVYTAHGFHFYTGSSFASQWLYGGLEKLAAKWMDALVVINQEDEQAAKNKLHIEPFRLLAMPGIGIQPECYQVSTNITAVKSGLELPVNTRIILVVGELNTNKRPLNVLDAFRELECKDTVLLFAGDGPLKETLQAAVNRYGLKERVRLLGLRTDIPELLAVSSMLVLVSVREGLPRCVLEALAARVPVIGSDIRGTSDLLGGGCGILTLLGDQKAVAMAMKEVLQGGSDIQSMVEQASNKIKYYSIDHLLVLHEQLYEKLLKGEA